VGREASAIVATCTDEVRELSAYTHIMCAAVDAALLTGPDERRAPAPGAGAPIRATVAAAEVAP
jgi:hypothetical protein